MTAKTTRSEKTRARILDAAKACFSELGVAKSSMELIADSANTTKPTLYAHFGSKEALFEVVALGLAEELQSPVYDPFKPETPIKEQLYRLLSSYIDSLLESNVEQLVRAVMLEYAERRQSYTFDIACVKKNILLDWLNSAKEHGAINTQDVAVSSELIMSMVEGLIIWPAVMEVEKFDKSERSKKLHQLIEFSLNALA